MTDLHPDSIRLMERMGWTPCGDGYYEHGDYPMQQFAAQDALELAREQFRNECQRT